jgi:hypothetical protein
MSFLIPGPNQQFTLASGALCAGGSLVFTDSGTSTPRSVYADPDLNTDLGNVITLGSDGRPTNSGSPTQVWGDDGSYRVELLDSLGATVSSWPQDNIQGGDFGGVVVPDPATGTDGQAITTDGSVYELTTLRTLPDPSGYATYMLVSDGASWIPQAQPTGVTLPTGAVLQDSTSFTIGKFKVQTGTGTAATVVTGRSKSGTITFATAYTTCLHVDITITSSPLSTNGNMPSLRATISGSGATVLFTMGELSSPDSSFDFNASVTFTYTAFGIIA